MIYGGKYEECSENDDKKEITILLGLISQGEHCSIDTKNQNYMITYIFRPLYCIRYLIPSFFAISKYMIHIIG